MEFNLWVWIAIIVFGFMLGGCCNCVAWRMIQSAQKQNLIIEGLAAVLFVSLLLRFGKGWAFVQFGILACLLLTIALIDYRIWIIPDGLLVIGLLCYIPFGFLYEQSIWSWLIQGLLGGCSVAVPLFLFVGIADRVMQQETMGGGDLKLFFLLGVYLGPLQTVLALFLSCLIGLLAQLLQQQWHTGHPFPFVPSIAIAVWITVLWGEPLLRWYLRI